MVIEKAMLLPAIIGASFCIENRFIKTITRYLEKQGVN
jgi:hypothetical protein